MVCLAVPVPYNVREVELLQQLNLAIALRISRSWGLLHTVGCNLDSE